MGKYSFHMYMFPFRWKIKEMEDCLFSEQINLNNIRYATSPYWERIPVPRAEKESDDLYNERNYFYDFVHPALYDDGTQNTINRHFERREPKGGEGNVTYRIVCGPDKKEYLLDVSAININLYSTGVGVLSFYLHNTRYPDADDILFINQYGRRVFPPFIADVQYRDELAHILEFDGLYGVYSEDFSSYSNKVKSKTPASFITKMVHEVAENIDLQPVVDDRMFVLSWYKNDVFAGKFKQNNDMYKAFLHSDWWYKYVYVDGGSKTCPNDDMSQRLIRDATYPRWQQWGTLYGVSRYSMVMLTSSTCPDYLLNYFETEYARMAELAFVQRATVLRFSSEISRISTMSVGKGFGSRVNSLYKEYIRFENQIYFREVSAQEQGIEMYKLLFDAMLLKEQVEKLDEEIEELYSFVSLREDRRTNRTMSLLTWITTIFLPVTVVAGYFSMNDSNNNMLQQSIVMACFAAIVISIVLIINKKRIK